MKWIAQPRCCERWLIDCSRSRSRSLSLYRGDWWFLFSLWPVSSTVGLVEKMYGGWKKETMVTDGGCHDVVEEVVWYSLQWVRLPAVDALFFIQLDRVIVLSCSIDSWPYIIVEPINWTTLTLQFEFQILLLLDTPSDDGDAPWLVMRLQVFKRFSFSLSFPN